MMLKPTMAVLAVLALGLGACATKKKEVKPEPTPVAAATPVVEKGSYVVKRGDSLWKISGRDGVLGDSFRWPLLFKANRDQIEDPDLIEPKQDLGYKKAYSQAEVDDAVKKAKETPPFVPHKSPRKVLPVQY